jgi:hypothetical protein
MSSPGFALGVEQYDQHKAVQTQKQDEERQAQLQTIANAGLPPEQQAEAIRTLYAKDPSALKQHIQNLMGRLRGQQPQPAPDAYPAQSATVGEAPLQVGNATLPAPPSSTVSQPGAKTQADRRAQILSGGTTPEQRRMTEIQAQADAKAPPAARNQTAADVVGAIMADDVSRRIDPNTDPRFQQAVSAAQSAGKQPAPKQKKAPKIITGSSGEPVGVTAEDEDGNQKNYYEKDMKTAPEDVSTLFKADQSAFKDKERRSEQQKAAEFARQNALLDKRVQDQLVVGDYRGAQKAVQDAEKKATDATVQSSIMEKAAPAAKQQDGPAMYTVLANFVKSAVGGTGMRVTQTEWNQAQQTRPWLQGVKAQVGPDGYLTGVKLAPEQIDSMVREGRQKSEAMNEAVDTVKQQHAEELEQGQELKGKGSKGKGGAPAPKAQTNGNGKKWSKKAYRAKHPEADIEAKSKEATAAGYEVVD